MEKIELVKLTIRLFSTMSVGTIVKNAVTATTPAGLNLGNRIMVGVGQFIVSSMVMEAADHYVENRLNALHMAYSIWREQQKVK